MANIEDIKIETERLVLRPTLGKDFDSYCEMMADPETAEYIGGVMNRSQAWRSWCTMVGAWYVRGFGMFSLLLKKDRTWIGRIGPWQPEGWPGTEVGWAISPEYAGKGYALEAAAATMNYAADQLGWTDICHTINPENIASAKLAARLGSTNRGPTQLPFPFEGDRVDDWGQSAAQWQENRKQFQQEQFK